jgi:tRNA-splicing ligase RtcB
MPKQITANLTSWASELDDNALEQALRTSRLPILAGPVCLMADAHFGLGATVGSVVATKNAVLPSAVGVDIGCGMVASETNVSASELPDDLSALHGLLRDRIPAGVGKGHVGSETRALPALESLGLPPGSASELSERQLTTIAMQYGSLGSGNHFVEVCLDERDRVWVVLHSGSRGIGNQLATAHIKTARLIAQEEGQVLEDRDLAWLAEGRPEFDAYVADMLWAQRYAWGNREQMMDAALAALRVACHTQSRPSGSTVTTTTPPRRPTGAKRSGSPAREPSGPDAPTWASSRAQWARRRSSCVARAARRRTSRAPMEPAGGSVARRRSAS